MQEIYSTVTREHDFNRCSKCGYDLLVIKTTEISYPESYLEPEIIVTVQCANCGNKHDVNEWNINNDIHLYGMWKRI